MKNESFDVKYENDARIFFEGYADGHVVASPLVGAKADNVPFRQILENKTRIFCSQTMNHNVSFI